MDFKNFDPLYNSTSMAFEIDTTYEDNIKNNDLTHFIVHFITHWTVFIYFQNSVLVSSLFHTHIKNFFLRSLIYIQKKTRIKRNYQHFCFFFHSWISCLLYLPCASFTYNTTLSHFCVSLSILPCPTHIVI